MALLRAVEALGFEIVDPIKAKRDFISVALEEADRWDYKTRQYRPTLRCGSCGIVGRFNTCGQIIHNHLVYCRNLISCADAQRKRELSCRFSYERTDEAVAQNIGILSREFDSISELREREPYTYYRFSGGVAKVATPWRNRIFDGVEELIPGWRGRKRKCPDISEISRVIEAGRRAGAVGGVYALRDALSKVDRLILADAIALRHSDFLICAQDLNYPMQRSYAGMGLEDVLEYLKANGISTVGALRSLEPGLLNYIRRQHMTEDVYSRLGWLRRPIYVEMSDNELVDMTCILAREYQANQARPCNFSIIEYQFSSALIREIRHRGLQGVVVDAMGWEATFRWQSMRMDEIQRIITEKRVFSLSDLHSTLPGCYKELVRRNALDQVAKLQGWRIPCSVLGRRCYSRIECVALSLLDLNNLIYSSSPRIHQFSGRKGGVIKADILLGDGRIVEIWATQLNSRPSGPYSEYPEIRRYKEQKYKESHPDFISIEGIAFYKKLPELRNQPGLEGFINYLASEFKKHGIALAVNRSIVEKIRMHLIGTFDDIESLFDPSDTE
jgi:hypothetical protein